MEIDIETTWQVLIIMIFILMAFSLFVMIRYGKESKWLYLLVPFILVLTLLTQPTIDKMLGYPIYTDEIKEELYISHIVGVEQKWIYIWSVDTSVSYIPRAYKIEYTLEKEKQLAKAKAAQGQGRPQGISLREARNGGEHETEEALRLYDFDKMKGVRKNE